jgi:hypothetical protein
MRTVLHIVVAAPLLGGCGGGGDGSTSGGGEAEIPADQVCVPVDGGMSKLPVECTDSVTSIVVVHGDEAQCVEHVECLRAAGAECYAAGCEAECCTDAANACYAASADTAGCE